MSLSRVETHEAEVVRRAYEYALTLRRITLEAGGDGNLTVQRHSGDGADLQEEALRGLKNAAADLGDAVLITATEGAS